MKHANALRSSVGGVAVGGLFAGSMWWAEGFLDGSIVPIAGVGIVWAAATTSILYVFQSYPHQRGDSGPWGAAIGGSLFFGVVLDLSDVSISNDASTVLAVLAIGTTLLGYAAGMATVYRQNRMSQPPDETVTDN